MDCQDESNSDKAVFNFERLEMGVDLMIKKYDNGQCRHFNGVQHETCDKGIRYDQFFPGMPCIQFIEESARGDTFLCAGEEPVRRVPRFRAQPTGRCQFYDEPTREEVQQYRKQRDEDMEKTAAAFGIAASWRVTVGAEGVLPEWQEQHKKNMCR